MGEDAVYIDELGNRVDPSVVGKTHDIVGQPSTTQKSQPNLLNQMMQEERVSNFLSQTSPTSTLQHINYILKGFVYDDTAKQWVKIAEGIPESIRLDFLQFITADLSEDVRMTNLDANQINGIMELSIEWAVDYLDIVADSHNLKEEQMTKIFLIMMKAIYYTLLRAQGGVEKSQIFKSLSLGEELSPKISPQIKTPWYSFWK